MNDNDSSTSSEFVEPAQVHEPRPEPKLERKEGEIYWEDLLDPGILAWKKEIDPAVTMGKSHAVVGI